MTPQISGKTWFLFRHFFAAYPVRSTLAILAMIFSGFAEGLGLAALFPLLTLVVGKQETESEMAVFVADSMRFVGIEPTIASTLIVICVMMTLKGVLVVAAMAQVGYTAAHVTAHMRLNLMRNLMLARWAFFVRQRAGSFTTALSSEPARAAQAYMGACNILVAAIQVVIYGLLALTISWEITVAAIIVGAFISYLLRGRIKIAKHAAAEQTRLHESLLVRVLDALAGMKPLKAMGQGKQLAPLVEEDIRSIRTADQQIVLSRETMQKLPEPLRVIVIAIAMYILLVQLGMALESLFVIIILFARTIERINKLQSYFQNVVSGLPGFWFVYRVTRRAALARETLHGGETPSLKSSIEMKRVSFSYGTTKVLKDVSLRIPAGRLAAIVGPSGSGKTTIADLLIGLLRPQQGRILIDGTDLEDIDLARWREDIGYVPQETILFHVSIKDNVTLEDPTITDEQVETSLKRAGAWEFVSKLPLGINTIAGERGAAFSGGQRQRIAIARALVRDPDLLILDEATTALDPETEAEICDTLKSLQGEVTILAISHQPALREVADIVYILKDGHIESMPASSNQVQDEMLESSP